MVPRIWAFNTGALQVKRLVLRTRRIRAAHGQTLSYASAIHGAGQ